MCEQKQPPTESASIISNLNAVGHCSPKLPKRKKKKLYFCLYIMLSNKKFTSDLTARPNMFALLSQHGKSTAEQLQFLLEEMFWLVFALPVNVDICPLDIR